MAAKQPTGYHLTNTSELEKLPGVPYLGSGHSARDLSPVSTHDGSISSDDSQRSGQSVVASKSTYTPETVTEYGGVIEVTCMSTSK